MSGLRVVDSGGHQAEIARLRDKRSRMAEERAQLCDRHQDSLTGADAGVDRAEGLNERIGRLDIDNVQKAIDALVDEERTRIADAVASGRARLESGDGASTVGYDRGLTTMSRFAGDPWNPGERLEIRDRARYALDAVARDTILPSEHAAERVTRALDGHDGADLDVLARWTATASDPSYLSAFTKLARDPQNGHREFTGAELDAFQRTQHLARAMSLTDAAGGYLVPFQLDPSVMISSGGTISPVRRLARQVVATGDVWNGVSSPHVSASWKAEGAESTDDATTFAQPTVAIHKLNAFVPISIEASMDAENVAQEVARLLVDGKDQLEDQAWLEGTGSGQPFGISIANLPAGSKVATTTADTLVAADVIKPQNPLPPRWQANAAWLANLTTINQIAAFEVSAGGALRYPDVFSDRLLRKPLFEASHMDTAGATATAGNDAVLLYGDFAAGYVIADRIGTVIEFIPHLFHTANNRPSGTRGWYMFARVGGNIVVADAFRLLTA